MIFNVPSCFLIFMFFVSSDNQIVHSEISVFIPPKTHPLKYVCKGVLMIKSFTFTWKCLITPFYFFLAFEVIWLPKKSAMFTLLFWNSIFFFCQLLKVLSLSMVFWYFTTTCLVMAFFIHLVHFAVFLEWVDSSLSKILGNCKQTW